MALIPLAITTALYCTITSNIIRVQYTRTCLSLYSTVRALFSFEPRGQSECVRAGLKHYVAGPVARHWHANESRTVLVHVLLCCCVQVSRWRWRAATNSKICAFPLKTLSTFGTCAPTTTPPHCSSLTTRIAAWRPSRLPVARHSSSSAAPTRVRAPCSSCARRPAEAPLCCSSSGSKMTCRPPATRWLPPRAAASALQRLGDCPFRSSRKTTLWPLSVWPNWVADSFWLETSGAKALEVIDARNANDIRRLEEPVALESELFWFSYGTADGKELLAVIFVEGSVAHSASAAGGGVQRLAGTASVRAPDAHCNRRRTSGLSRPAARRPRAARHVGRVSMSHAVECHSVSGATPPQPQVLTAERQVHINCWRVAGERVLLFDANHLELQSLECALLSGLDSTHFTYVNSCCVQCSAVVLVCCANCRGLVSAADSIARVHSVLVARRPVEQQLIPTQCSIKMAALSTRTHIVLYCTVLYILYCMYSTLRCRVCALCTEPRGSATRLYAVAQ